MGQEIRHVDARCLLANPSGTPPSWCSGPETNFLALRKGFHRSLLVDTNPGRERITDDSKSVFGYTARCAGRLLA